MIAAHNAANKDFTLEMNEQGDLSNEEREKLFNPFLEQEN